MNRDMEQQNQTQLLLSHAKQQLQKSKHKEQQLKMTVTVLLSRSESQILVLETLLKRLVQVCVHTQDKRLAKELKLIDFTRLAKRLSMDHCELRKQITGESAPPAAEANGEAWKMQHMEDPMGQPSQSQFPNQPHASTSGRMPEGMPRRPDSASGDPANNPGLGSMYGTGSGMNLQGMQGMQGSFGNGRRGGSNQMMSLGNRNPSGTLGGLGGYSGY